MQLTLPQIEGKVREFATVINAPEDFIPTFGYSQETGLPHIEIYNESYYLKVSENGKQISEKHTKDPDELLFMIMHTITLSMACERMVSDTQFQSFRMRLFQAQKSIISKISLTYLSKIKVEQDTMKSDWLLS